MLECRVARTLTKINYGQELVHKFVVFILRCSLGIIYDIQVVETTGRKDNLLYSFAYPFRDVDDIFFQYGRHFQAPDIEQVARVYYLGSCSKR